MRLNASYLVAATCCIGCSLLIPSSDAFAPPMKQHHRILPFTSSSTKTTSTQRFVSSELEKEEVTERTEARQQELVNPLLSKSKIPARLRIEGNLGIPPRNSKIQLLDTSTYESSLINVWEEDPDRQKGFDWEVEKARRYFAGLRMRDDGSWIRKESFFEFLISKHRITTSSSNSPSPVNPLDVFILFTINILSFLGLGPTMGMPTIPTAVIQKYEGSFLSFIKGVLGGDLQTLAGGPLFLLLAKYFRDYGPIFNLAFGPKAFLVISDPVMAKHILKTAPTDQYCKGMLAEILEPIMGKGLIPADPATWKVRGNDFFVKDVGFSPVLVGLGKNKSNEETSIG
jgi:hypothetical protein